MPYTLPEGAAEVPPVSAGEAAEPLGLLAEETPERRARPSRRLVNPALMPSAEQVWVLHAAEVSARQAIAARPASCVPGLTQRHGQGSAGCGFGKVASGIDGIT